MLPAAPLAPWMATATAAHLVHLVAVREEHLRYDHASPQLRSCTVAQRTCNEHVHPVLQALSAKRMAAAPPQPMDL